MSDTPSSGLNRRPPARNNLKPCHLWRKGSCRFGERCKFSHEQKPTTSTNNDPTTGRGSKVEEDPNARYRRFDAQTSRREANLKRGNTNPNESTSAKEASNPTLPVDRKAKQSDTESTIPKAPVCRLWLKTGSCRFGDRCKFHHASDDAQPGVSHSKTVITFGTITEERSQQESTSNMPPHSRRRKQRDAENAKSAEENRKRKEAAAKRAREQNERRLAREKKAREAQEAAARQSQLQLEARRKWEASVIEQDIVLGSSLITYGAGLDVQNVITGFDLCKVTIKNLPRNAKHEEIVHIFTQQGIEKSSFFIGQFKDNGMHREATVLMKAEEGKSIAIGLQGIEFCDHYLTFEVSGDTGGNTVTMGSSARNSDCLTVYWRAPSETFIVTYSSTDEARRKIRELDGTICKGQRIKAQMDQPPPHRLIFGYHNELSIKLSGFPIGTFPDDDLTSFVGSNQIRALTSTSCGLQESHDILRRHLQLCPNIKIETYQNLTPKPVDGNVRVKVQFETWEDAKSAYDSINDKRIHNSPFFHASLPNPLEYNIFIPRQQYDAQKKQWDSLTEKTPERDAHVQTRISNCENVSIRVLGQDKKAVGTLKVRVEHMVAGKRLDPEFWHPSFSAPNQRVFFDRIYQARGVYVKADIKTKSLKTYGGSDAMVEEARKMVKEEVDRLAKLETTELLNQASVGFFVRGGLGKLKELLGEENATMSFGTRGCHITIKGGEEGKLHLNRLIAESRTARFVDQTLPGDIEKETCPICTDEISHAEQLGCGHSYCSGCLQHYLESAPHTRTFPLVCIGDEGACKVPISIPEIRRFLQPQVFQALVEVAFRSYLDQHAQELKFCTTPDCQQIYRHSANTRILQCPSCFSTICSACDEEGHEGMTCQEHRLHKDPAEQDRLFNVWANEHGKQCPECRRVIEKIEGCNHMTCPCGAHFCWQCGESFSATTIYNHMNTAHGGIYTHDQAPVWANPNNVGENNFEEQARLLAQARQEMMNARIRQQNALRAQMMEDRRCRQIQIQQDAFRQQQQEETENANARVRQQNALRAQMIERTQVEQQNTLYAQMMENRRRQLRNDEDAARRRRENDSGSWCVVM